MKYPEWNLENYIDYYNEWYAYSNQIPYVNNKSQINYLTQSFENEQYTNWEDLIAHGEKSYASGRITIFSKIWFKKKRKEFFNKKLEQLLSQEVN